MSTATIEMELVVKEFLKSLSEQEVSAVYEMFTANVANSGTGITQMQVFQKHPIGKRLKKLFDTYKFEHFNFSQQETVRKFNCYLNWAIANTIGKGHNFVSGSAKDGSAHAKICENTKENTPNRILAQELLGFIYYTEGYEIINTKKFRENGPMKIANRIHNRYNQLRRKHKYAGGFERNFGNYMFERKYFSFIPTKEILDTDVNLFKTEIDKTTNINPAKQRIVEVYNTNIRTQPLIDKKIYEELKENLLPLNELTIENGCIILVSDELFLKVQKNEKNTYDLISLTDEKIVKTCPSKAYIVAMINNLIENLETIEISIKEANMLRSEVVVAPPEEFEFKTVRKFQ